MVESVVCGDAGIAGADVFVYMCLFICALCVYTRLVCLFMYVYMCVFTCCLHAYVCLFVCGMCLCRSVCVLSYMCICVHFYVNV